jgi:hypothetical protein
MNRYDKNFRQNTGLLAIAIIALLFFSSCASFNSAVENGAREVLSQSLDEGFDRAEDRGEDAAERVVNNTLRGSKKIIGDYTRGCVDITVTRSDDGKINGKREVFIPAASSKDLRIKIPTFSSDRDRFQLIAKRVGEIPPGCDDIHATSETFRFNHRSDGWRIRLR